MEFGYIVIRYRNLSLYCKSWYRDTTVCAFILILITTLEDRAIISKRYFVHFKKVVLFWLTTYQSWVSVQFCSQNWYIQWIRIVSTMSHALHSFQGSIVDLTKKRSPIKLSKNLPCFIRCSPFSNVQFSATLHTRRAFQLGCFESFYLSICADLLMSCQSQICTNGISLERLIADFQFMKVMEVGTWPTIRISNFLFICFHEFDPISSNICAHDPLKQRLSYKLSNETYPANSHKSNVIWHKFWWS